VKQGGRFRRNRVAISRETGWPKPVKSARYDRDRLESLEDRSSRPARRRRPARTLAQLAAVRRLRARYPRRGKDKLAILLRREGSHLAVAHAA